MDNNQDFQTEFEEAPAAPVEVPKGQAIKSMVFGILSIYFGFMPIGSILGIIFSRIACANAKKFLADYPVSPVGGIAKAGRITGKIGLPVSIVFTVFWTLYIAGAVIIGILAGLGALG